MPPSPPAPSCPLCFEYQPNRAQTILSEFFDVHNQFSEEQWARELLEALQASDCLGRFCCAAF